MWRERGLGNTGMWGEKRRKGFVKGAEKRKTSAR